MYCFRQRINRSFVPFTLPSTPTGHGKCLPLPEPGTASVFFLLKRSFSFPLTGGHLIERSLLYNLKHLQAAVVVWCCINTTE